MEILHSLVDLLFHIDVHLDYAIANYHSWTYLLLFLIIFVETGLVIMPFLPGDSLLFAIGAFTARGSFEFWSISFLILSAAILGDTINYAIGKYFGEKLFNMPESRLFNRNHLRKAHDFYEKHGAKTIILARFVPIVRTFAPFVAGMGSMTYKRFMSYNVIGAAAWIFSFIPLGYFFGNLPYIKGNLKSVMLAIIFISILPGIIEYIRVKRKS
ncbi:MAG: DedA family protein [Bacteriovorax sp.]|jgi:membrane-associated protein